MLRGDCTTLLAEVVEATPSIVIGATSDGEDVFDVAITMDGAALVGQLDGKPIDVNPGLHSFLFERAGLPSVEKKVIVAAHRRHQTVAVQWKTAPAAVAPPAVVAPSAAAQPVRPVKSASLERPIPAEFYVLGGAAVAGLATFAVLGLTGDASQHDLALCAPRCPEGEVDSLQNRFIAADIALGVGALSAAGAFVVFLTRPQGQTPSGQRSAIHVRPRTGGASVDWSCSF
jgi:hypothetical protein